MRRSDLVPLVLLVMVGLGAGCKKKSPAAEDPRAQEVQRRDKECAQDLRGTAHEEARSWCAPTATSHMGFKMGRDDMLRLAEELYSAGALKVEVVGIDTLGDRQIAAQFAVLLPGSTASRKAVLDLLGKYDFDEKAPPDLGQSCALLSLD